MYRSHCVAVIALLVFGSSTHAQQVDAQPLRALAERLETSMKFLGQPFSNQVTDELHAAMKADNAVVAIQQVLDEQCLAIVDINAESRVKVNEGAAAPRLVEQGWTAYLVKVNNLAGDPDVSFWQMLAAYRDAGWSAPRLVLPIPVPYRVAYELERAQTDLDFVNRAPLEAFTEMRAQAADERH